jgi:hypothetical protein
MILLLEKLRQRHGLSNLFSSRLGHGALFRPAGCRDKSRRGCEVDEVVAEYLDKSTWIKLVNP